MRDKVTDEELEKMAEQMTPESFNERYLCDFATQPDPSPASVQSAEDLVLEVWNQQEHDREDEAVKLIEADRAAQRQIGRDEAKEADERRRQYELFAERRIAKISSDIEILNARYAAVVEALRLAERYINDGSALPADKNHPYYKVSEAIEKALSDLDKPSATQDAKED